MIRRAVVWIGELAAALTHSPSMSVLGRCTCWDCARAAARWHRSAADQAISGAEALRRKLERQRAYYEKALARERESYWRAVKDVTKERDAAVAEQRAAVLRLSLALAASRKP